MTTQKKIVGITPAGIASYPYLNKPDTQFNADGDYKVELILGAEETEELREKIAEMTADQFAAVSAELDEKLKNAKTGAEKAKIKKALEGLTETLPYVETVDDEGDPDGGYKFKFKTKASFKDKKTGKVIQRKLKLFDAKKKPVDVPVFGGSTLKVAYEIAPYFMMATGCYGVSLRMNAVQIIELQNNGGGSTGDSYGFDEEEGFEGDDAPAVESENPGAGMTDEDDGDF